MPTTLPSRSRAPTKITFESRDNVSDWTTNHDLTMVIALGAIGLLISISVILCYPDFGTLIESYNQF
jgi:hypothetical protein